MNFCWCTITVRDMEESIRFYTEIVGLSAVRRFKPAPPVEIAFLDDEKGSEIELIQYRDKDVPGDKEGISIGFAVDSLEKALELVESKGIAVSEGPVTTPTAKFFFVKDPNGVTVQFVERPE
jgi:lactoylglutathione lyase